jgi:DNA-3-methyladenine glycosylase
VNVVTRPPDVPEAVLIRALEPLEGIELMRPRRDQPDGPVARLCRGPGALCQALAIDRSRNGADLLRSALRILDRPDVPARLVGRSARIGVAYAGPDAARPWRFFVTDSVAVSGPGRGRTRRD